MKSRTKARSIALQVLYEYDLTGHPLGEVLTSRLEENQSDEAQASFCHSIVVGVAPIFAELDEVIAAHAPALNA